MALTLEDKLVLFFQRNLELDKAVESVNECIAEIGFDATACVVGLNRIHFDGSESEQAEACITSLMTNWQTGKFQDEAARCRDRIEQFKRDRHDG